MKNQLLAFLSLFCLGACVDRIQVDIGAETPKIVVDGFITNEQKAHVIRISHTSPFSNLKAESIVADTVEIIGSNGQYERLYPWFVQGEYRTSDDFFAIPDVEYVLRVVIGGIEINSNPVGFRDTVGVDSISYRPSTRRVFRAIDNSIEEVDGVDLNVSLPNNNSDRYFMWRLIPTFIWKAELAPEGSANAVCYIEEPFYYNNIYVYHDSEGEFDYTLAFLEASRKWATRYSMHIKQYNISEDAYRYWLKLREQGENVGSIFDTTPTSVHGNLHNVSGSNEPVFGYFGAYYASEQRMFFSLDDMPFNHYLPPICEVGGPLPPPEICMNCWKWRGKITNIQPEWWE